MPIPADGGPDAAPESPAPKTPPSGKHRGGIPFAMAAAIAHLPAAGYDFMPPRASADRSRRPMASSAGTVLSSGRNFAPLRGKSGVPDSRHGTPGQKKPSVAIRTAFGQNRRGIRPGNGAGGPPAEEACAYPRPAPGSLRRPRPENHRSGTLSVCRRRPQRQSRRHSYRRNNSSRYFGSGQIWSSTISSSLSI